ncbi:MAG TPA: caspase family protein [Gemmataceae bacterium]|nr:caspase family protein [Gemmataceae bacterium]
MSQPRSRGLALLALALGVALLGRTAGTAEDVDHGDEVKRRLAQWKSTPHAELLFKGVQFQPVTVAANGKRAVALCIGVNRVNPAHYGPGVQMLSGCVNDAEEMARIANGRGFETHVLRDSEARVDTVLDFIRAQARAMEAGDICLLSFSGHGSQVPDIPPNQDEDDGADETLCLYDRQLIDDELAEEFRAFRPGVRLLLFTDSCHSGTVAKGAIVAAKVLERPPAKIAGRLRGPGRVVEPRVVPPPPAVNFAVRRIDPAVGMALFRTRPEYDVVKRRTLRGDKAAETDLPATLLHFAACADSELAIEMGDHGVFTAVLLDVWGNGAFTGTYRDFYAAIVKEVPRQNPKYRRYGPANPAFEDQQPFTTFAK